ncbi:DNA polymerase subunit beta [Methanosphaera sp.]
MIVQPRDYIETKDHLFFAVNTYTHPENAYIAFLRYVPCVDGDREINGVKYKKVDSDEAYEYLRKNHPNYLFTWNIENKKMMGVPREDILEIRSPITRLNEIINSETTDEYYRKVSLLAKTFHEGAGISYEDMGITGSTLLHLQKPAESDIDFIIYGLENHAKAINLYSKLKNDENSVLDKIDDEYWNRIYKKRIKDNSLTQDEYKWYENRRNNRGLIQNTLFDITLTLKPEEILPEEIINIKQVGRMTIKCKISDASQSYNVPATYIIEDVEVLEGPNVNIKKILSYTHTYTGIVQNNERVIASGMCEKVISKEDENPKYNLIIGTTRESLNEYIKLEKSPI